MIDNSISDLMKQIWINLELYFEIYEFSNFSDFFKIFSKNFNKFFGILMIFSEFKID